MPGAFVNVETLMLLIASIMNVVLTIILLRKLSKTNKDSARLIVKNQQFREENKEIKITAKRVFLIARRHDSDIECMKLQMAQVHHWLGEVLSISSLIEPEPLNMDDTNMIEELRQRAAWAKEAQKNKTEDDYYNG